jgi:two-component system nitrate/nitrite response regulator NarL
MSNGRPTKEDAYGTRDLHPRELRISELVSEGLENKTIAAQLGTTESTIKNYLRVIFDKVGCSNRVGLALWYVAHNE